MNKDKLIKGIGRYLIDSKYDHSLTADSLLQQAKSALKDDMKLDCIGWIVTESNGNKKLIIGALDVELLEDEEAVPCYVPTPPEAKE